MTLIVVVSRACLSQLAAVLKPVKSDALQHLSVTSVSRAFVPLCLLVFVCLLWLAGLLAWLGWAEWTVVD